MIGLDGTGVERRLAEDDEGGVGAELTGLREIVGEGCGDGVCVWE